LKYGISCSVQGCPMKLCLHCKQWHPLQTICDKFAHPRCPKCQVLTERNSGCPHMACPCGQDWCFLCGEGFRSAEDCYDHISEVHDQAL
jgi:hypothetical protein